MTSTLKNKLKSLPVARQNKIKKRAQELTAREMTLRDLRKAFELAEVEVCSKLQMNQEAVSRLERRSDILLSTLISYIKAMGGELNLTAKFPNRPAVTIKGFEDIEKHHR